jgi:predicted nucleic acid-binding protein
LDSGILLASIQQNEPYTLHARTLIERLLASSVQLAAPALLRYELVAVLRKWVYRGLISPQQAEQALDVLLSYPVTLHFDDALLRRGYALATDYNRPTAYDAQYLALAERLDCEFWTADERLFNAVRGALPRVRWVGAG